MDSRSQTPSDYVDHVDFSSDVILLAVNFVTLLFQAVKVSQNYIFPLYVFMKYCWMAPCSPTKTARCLELHQKSPTTFKSMLRSCIDKLLRSKTYYRDFKKFLLAAWASWILQSASLLVASLAEVS